MSLFHATPFVHTTHKASDPGFDAGMRQCGYIRAKESRIWASGSIGIAHFLTVQKLQDVEAHTLTMFNVIVVELAAPLSLACTV